MERKILFKAKRLDNGKWVKGYYTYYPLGIGGNEEASHIIRDTSRKPGTMWFVDSSTLCQNTGLTDSNNQQIWENDIVQIKLRDKCNRDKIIVDEKEKVIYKDGAFGVLWGYHREFTVFDGFYRGATTLLIVGNGSNNIVATEEMA